MNQIIEQAKIYKRKVAGAYVSITKDDIFSKIIGEKVYVTTKIDGEFNLLHFDGTKTILVNAHGKIKDDFTFLSEITTVLNKANYTSLTLACELHLNVKDKRTRVFEVMSAIANDKQSLRISSFDIVEINGEEHVNGNYEDTIAKIIEISKDSKSLNCVDFEVVSAEQVIEIYEQKVTQGNQEGLVVRFEDIPIVYKIKPLHTLDLAVVGYTTDSETSVRELLLGMLDEDNNYVQVARVGTGLNQETKEKLYDTLSNTLVESSYIEADKRRVAFHLVKPSLVVEVSINELLTENTKGLIKNTLLSYNDKDGYSFLRSINGVSFLHPVFKRIRHDKKVDTHDVRHTQVTDIVYVEEPKASASGDFPKSEIIFREVYTKTSKGKTNVLKFLAWKTNKASIDKNYPAFVMNYTNFSPTRAESLKKDVRVSSSEEQILSLVHEFKEKNVKKGWQLVSEFNIESKPN